MAYCTLADIQVFLTGLDATAQTAVSALIPYAETAVNNYIHKSYSSSDFVEEYYNPGAQIILTNTPVTEWVSVEAKTSKTASYVALVENTSYEILESWGRLRLYTHYYKVRVTYKSATVPTAVKLATVLTVIDLYNRMYVHPDSSIDSIELPDLRIRYKRADSSGDTSYAIPSNAAAILADRNLL